MAAKRKLDDDPIDSDSKKGKPSREKCLFGEKCYRRNPIHFQEYSHPHLEALDASVKPENASQTVQDQWQILKGLNLLTKVQEPEKRVAGTENKKSSEEENILNEPDSNKKAAQREEENSPQRKVEETDKTVIKENSDKMHPLVQKLEAAKPYNLFLTKVKGIKSTHNDKNSLFLTDLLHSCHGDLQKTVQINFLVDYEWLKMCYEATGNENIPLLILYGEENPDLNPSKLPYNTKALRIKPPSPFGTHHTKVMILVYNDDSVRIVVSTANLVPSDWENRTQGLWVSPRCRQSPQNPKDSVTGFKASFIRYLTSYQVSPLHQYIDLIKSADFSQINACFVGSSPGSHGGSSLCHFGHMAAGSILRKHTRPKRWPLIMQCSSIGSLGQAPNTWCMSELSSSLGPQNNDVQIVYPSEKNVLGSLDGIFGGGCLPYRRNVHEKQPWIRDYFHQWRSDKFDRTKAMPHIKTYAQIEGQRSNYILLTSANLSKAAWGKLNKAGDKLHIMSYEAGVLLLPKFVLGDNEETFDLSQNRVLLPYDVPLTKFSDEDVPFFYDFLIEATKD